MSRLHVGPAVLLLFCLNVFCNRWAASSSWTCCKQLSAYQFQTDVRIVHPYWLTALPSASTERSVYAAFHTLGWRLFSTKYDTIFEHEQYTDHHCSLLRYTLDCPHQSVGELIGLRSSSVVVSIKVVYVAQWWVTRQDCIVGPNCPPPRWRRWTTKLCIRPVHSVGIV